MKSTLLLALTISMFSVSAVRADWWDPFKITKTTTVPGLNGKPITKTSGGNPVTSSVSKMTKSTKRAMNKTWDAITPGKSPEIEPPSGQYKTIRKKNKQEEPGFFKSLFSTKEPRQAETPSEWLGLKRPGI